MTVRRYPAKSSTAGEDTRIDANDRSDHPFHQSFVAWPDMRTPGGFDTSSRIPEIEVQAYIPYDYSGRAVIALCLHGPLGQADTMLSAAEAHAVALALLRSADDAERLQKGS